MFGVLLIQCRPHENHIAQMCVAVFGKAAPFGPDKILTYSKSIHNQYHSHQRRLWNGKLIRKVNLFESILIFVFAREGGWPLKSIMHY